MMELLTKEIVESLPRFRETEGQAADAIAVVKYFTPWTGWTWYGIEYDPETRQFFGLVDGQFVELGYFSLDELKSIKGPFGLKVERDLYWTPVRIGDIETHGQGGLHI